MKTKVLSVIILIVNKSFNKLLKEKGRDIFVRCLLIWVLFWHHLLKRRCYEHGNKGHSEQNDRIKVSINKSINARSKQESKRNSTCLCYRCLVMINVFPRTEWDQRDWVTVSGIRNVDPGPEVSPLPATCKKCTFLATLQTYWTGNPMYEAQVSVF